MAKGTICKRVYRSESGILEFAHTHPWPVAAIMRQVDKVQFVEDLVGWGRWTKLYQFSFEADETQLWAVDGSINSNN